MICVNGFSVFCLLLLVNLFLRVLEYLCDYYKCKKVMFIDWNKGVGFYFLWEIGFLYVSEILCLKI